MSFPGCTEKIYGFLDLLKKCIGFPGFLKNTSFLWVAWKIYMGCPWVSRKIYGFREFPGFPESFQKNIWVSYELSERRMSWVPRVLRGSRRVSSKNMGFLSSLITKWVPKVPRIPREFPKKIYGFPGFPEKCVGTPSSPSSPVSRSAPWKNVWVSREFLEECVTSPDALKKYMRTLHSKKNLQG